VVGWWGNWEGKITVDGGSDHCPILPFGDDATTRLPGNSGGRFVGTYKICKVSNYI
jgi:hypothetical protein